MDTNQSIRQPDDQKRNPIFLILPIIIIIAIVGYLAMRNNSDADPEVTATIDNSPQKTNEVTTSPSANIKIFTITANNFNFSLPEIKVKKDDNVKIILKNTDGFHDWVLDEFNAKTSKIGTGKESEIQFIADKTGTFEYYCSVGNHRQQGMRGKLIVE